MTVALAAVRTWWRTTDGVGHALAWDCACTCGHCDTYGALCGLTGREGEITPFRPDDVCPACRTELAAPTLVARTAVQPVILIQVTEVTP